MDLEPRTVKVTSEAQLQAQVSELEKQGRRVIECNAFENGLRGKLAFWPPPEGHDPKKWTPQDADAVWLTWEICGRMLQPEKIVVTSGDELFKLFGEHRDHGITGFLNATDRIAGFVCFCKAKEGKSLVFSVRLDDAKGIPPELLKYLEPAAQVIDPTTRESP
jgi:hypothetical protein